MSKLIIPAAELIGSPLTQEELKGIIAGFTNSGGSCTCDWILSNYTSSTSDLGYVDSETVCAEKCSEKCNSDPVYKCANFKATYTGTTTGPM